jgi:hypothetical protein
MVLLLLLGHCNRFLGRSPAVVTDYLLKSLKMDFAIPFDTPKDGHLVFDEVVWERVESSKI